MEKKKCSLNWFEQYHKVKSERQKEKELQREIKGKQATKITENKMYTLNFYEYILRAS